MGLGSLFRRLLGGRDTGRDVEELARRLDVAADELRTVRPGYREFRIPKRGGGSRNIAAPSDELKALQRRILRRVLGRLATHPAATGFQRDESIVTNARQHTGKALVVRMDLREFFASTSAEGWALPGPGSLIPVIRGFKRWRFRAIGSGRAAEAPERR